MTTTLQLVTPRLTLRPWQERDRAPYAQMNADAKVMTFFPALMTREESDESIDRYLAGIAQDGYSFFAAEHRETADFAGLIGLKAMRDAVPNLPQPAIEIGWRLQRKYQGQGLATEGAKAVVNFAFQQLHLPEVVAVVAVGNVASRNIMNKLGMTHRPELVFDHPRFSSGHPHLRHELYHLRNPKNE